MQVVLSSVEGSPAARAGIHDGDELLEINGTSLVKHLTVLFQQLNPIEKSNNIIPLS